MRKLMMLAAMLSMLVALTASPAMARDRDRDDFFDNHRSFLVDDLDFDDFDHDFDFDNFDQDIGDTGDVSLSLDVSSTGNNSNQCVAPLQFGNTGNLQNLQGFSQFGSFADDIDFDGSSFEFAPEQAVSCGQSVQQSAVASGR